MSQVQAYIEQAVAAAEARAREVVLEALGGADTGLKAAGADVDARLAAAEARIEALEAKLAASGAADKPVASRTRTTKS